MYGRIAEKPPILPSNIEEALATLKQVQNDESLYHFPHMKSTINFALEILCLRDKFTSDKAFCESLVDQIAGHSLALVEAAKEADQLVGKGTRLEAFEKYLKALERLWDESYQNLLAFSSEAGLFRKVLAGLYREIVRKNLEETATVLCKSEDNQAFMVLGDAILKMAIAENKKGNENGAEQLLERVVTSWTNRFGEDQIETLLSKHKLAELYVVQRRFSEAEQIETAVCEACNRTVGPGHPATLTSMQLLVVIYSHQYQFTKALTVQESVVKGRKKLLGDTNPFTVDSLAALASLYRKDGRLDEAEKLASFCLERHSLTGTAKDGKRLRSMHRLAQVYWKQGRLTEAENLEKKVIELNGGLTEAGQRDRVTLLAAKTLAYIYRDQGRLSEAEDWDDLFEKNKDVIPDFTPERYM